jgi:hypothetical protein
MGVVPIVNENDTVSVSVRPTLALSPYPQAVVIALTCTGNQI